MYQHEEWACAAGLEYLQRLVKEHGERNVDFKIIGGHDLHIVVWIDEKMKKTHLRFAWNFNEYCLKQLVYSEGYKNE